MVKERPFSETKTITADGTKSPATISRAKGRDGHVDNCPRAAYVVIIVVLACNQS